jgi:hypothetical protein
VNNKKMLNTVLGKHFINSFKLVNNFNEIPKALSRSIWKVNAEKAFKSYQNHGQFFYAKKYDELYLIYLSYSDNEILIKNKRDETINPSRLEMLFGLGFIGLSLRDFLEYLIKREDIKESKKVVRLTESELIRLVTYLMKN